MSVLGREVNQGIAEFFGRSVFVSVPAGFDAGVVLERLFKSGFEYDVCEVDDENSISFYYDGAVISGKRDVEGFL